jgi:hypothetical protein
MREFPGTLMAAYDNDNTIFSYASSESTMSSTSIRPQYNMHSFVRSQSFDCPKKETFGMSKPSPCPHDQDHLQANLHRSHVNLLAQ